MTITDFVNTMPFVTGVYLILIALLMNTENIRSAMLFKVIPFFLGVSCLFTSGKLLGWF